MMENPLDRELAALDHDVGVFLRWALPALATFVFAVWLAIALIFTGHASTGLWIVGGLSLAWWAGILWRVLREELGLAPRRRPATEDAYAPIYSPGPRDGRRFGDWPTNVMLGLLAIVAGGLAIWLVP